MGKLPEPMTDFDVADVPDLPMDAKLLREASISRKVEGEAFRAAVLLWCHAWHQVPAASLPNDDAALAAMLDLSRKAWSEIKARALFKFELCSDGRLYHPVLARKARAARDAADRAIRAEQANRIKTQAATLAAAERRKNSRAQNSGENTLFENSNKNGHSVRDGRLVRDGLNGVRDGRSPRSVGASGVKSGAGQTKTAGVDRRSRRAPVSSCAVPAIHPGQPSPTSLAVKQQASTPDDRGVRGERVPAVVPKRQQKGNQIPENWTPPPDAWAYGREKLGLTDQQIEAYAEGMRLWAGANGHREVGRKQGEKGWKLAFMGWMRREEERRRERQSNRRPQAGDRLDPLQKAMQAVMEAEAAERSRR